MTMKKILDILDKIEVAVASLVLLVLICVTFFGVLMRYIFNNPFTWEEELQLACMVWITFLAAPAAFRTKSHVAIEIAKEPEKNRGTSDPCCCIRSSDLLLLQKPELYRCYAAYKQKDPDPDDSVLYDLRDRAGLHRAHADQLYGAEIL